VVEHRRRGVHRGASGIPLVEGEARLLEVGRRQRSVGVDGALLGPPSRRPRGVPLLRRLAARARDETGRHQEADERGRGRRRRDPVARDEAPQQLDVGVGVGADLAAVAPVLDLPGQLRRGGVARVRRGAKRLGGDRRQVLGRLRLEAARVRRGLAPRRLQHLQHVVAPVRGPPREELEEDRAQGPHVAPLVDRLEIPPGLLRAHVGGRAHDRAVDGPTELGAADPVDLPFDVSTRQVFLPVGLREAPVEDDGLAELAEHDVVRLQIAVDHAPTVRVGDALAGGEEGVEVAQALGEIPGAAEGRPEGPPPDLAHHVVEGAVRALAELVDRHDGRVLELSGDPGLAEEADGGAPARRARAAPPDALLVSEELLDRDLPAEVDVEVAHHPTDGAAADLGVGLGAQVAARGHGGDLDGRGHGGRARGRGHGGRQPGRRRLHGGVVGGDGGREGGGPGDGVVRGERGRQGVVGGPAAAVSVPAALRSAHRPLRP
jgi:hypothetical protein